MRPNTGILSFGAYVPRKRLQRAAIHAANAWFAPGLAALAKGERAIADWDEDSITMAVEAARDALTAADRSKVTSISLASTTLPFVDRLNAGVVKEALSLSDGVAALDTTGSQRAGTSSLLQALRAASQGEALQLCVASELRTAPPASEAELQNGDGAAALVVGKGEPIARFLGAQCVTHDFVDHYRTPGMTHDYVWESRWIRDEGYTRLAGDALKKGLAALGLEAAAVDRLIVPIVARGVAQSLAKLAGVRAEAVADTLVDRLGDCGVAHPLIMLVAALEQARPGEKILLMGFGQGVDLLLFETTDALLQVAPRRGLEGSLARRYCDDNYLRWLFHRGLLGLERGLRAEADHKQPGTTLWRNRKAVLGLIAGRCVETGVVQYPRADISVNPNSRRAHTQEDYPLAERKARVVTFTADSLTYSPDPPTYYGMIDFDGGGRLSAEFADVAGETITVGREMQMVFRIKAVDELRHFTKYFWKASPVG
jgi:3-hydroxy-3-methylglutaryl CoA synthase/uncharacterized OB-fold protein